MAIEFDIRTVIETALGVVVLVASLQSLAVLLGLARKPRPKASDGTHPLVSVVIAARNEEEALPACLAAVFGQDYDRFEVIVVNDRSTDRTAALLEQACKRFRSLRVVTVYTPSENLTGKQNALHLGISQAKGELILSTDADCRPARDWVSTLTARLTAGDEMVFGITEIAPTETLGARFQAMELHFLFQVAVALAKLGMPGSCMGNNVGFRKDSYQKVGGYLKMGMQPTEDFALLRAFRKNKMKVSVIGNRSTVQSLPVKTFSEWYHQHMRWLAGSLSPKMWLFWSLPPVMVANWALVGLAVTRPVSMFLTAALGAKVATDLALLITRLPGRLWPALPFYYLYYLLSPAAYLVLYPFQKRIVWKSDRIPLRS